MSQPPEYQRARDEYVWEYGCSPDEPLFQLVPDWEPLTFDELFSRFVSCVRERPCAVQFSFVSDDEHEINPSWRLSVVPEGLQVVDSPHACALRGGRWHNDDSIWVISGWSQLCLDREVKRVGRGRIVTPRAWLGSKIEIDPSAATDSPFIGQLLPLEPTPWDGRDSPGPHWIAHPGQLLG